MRQCDIRGANKRDFPARTCRINLAHVSDRGKTLPLREVFYPISVSQKLSGYKFECGVKAHP